MPLQFVFGVTSQSRLDECDRRLQAVAIRALELTSCDFSIVCGHRGEAAQNTAFEEGASEKVWPTGKHNDLPSQALDFGAYPKPWDSRPKRYARYYLIYGAFHAASVELAIPIRWGGDWDGDGDMTDQKFDDAGHVELLNPPAPLEVSP